MMGRGDMHAPTVPTLQGRNVIILNLKCLAFKLRLFGWFG